MKKPIVLQRADPWVYLHSDGYYYFTGSVPGYQEIEIRRAKELTELETTHEKMNVWHAHESGLQSKLIWAPELHFINNKWYIYFAASDDEYRRDLEHHHRIFVLECSKSDPLTTSWEEKGQIITKKENFSLDATTFCVEDEQYLVWAEKEDRKSVV